MHKVNQRAGHASKDPRRISFSPIYQGILTAFYFPRMKEGKSVGGKKQINQSDW
jgi:hypothetical protein